MKIKVLKAVAALLFLLVSPRLFAQQIEIKVFEEGTNNKIEYFLLKGFSKNEHKTIPALIYYSLFSQYDSVLVQAFGYENAWIKYYSLSAEYLAANQNKNIPLNIILKPLLTEVNEVIISAGKFEEKKKDVARQITLIKQKDIEFMSQSNTADVLQSTGSVLVQKSQLGGGSPIIRGFEANKVQIVIDGVRLNNAIFRGGHLQNVLRMDNNALERVEVIQGAGSVIYGSDALGGVMHFVTKSPKLADTGKVLFMAGANARYGTASNELTGSLNFNIGFKKVALFTNLSYTHLGDLRQGSVGMNTEREGWKRNYYSTRINGRDTMLVNNTPLIQLNSGYTQLDVLQKVVYKQNDRIQHGLNFQYSTTGDIPRYDRLLQTDSAQSAMIEANRFISENPTSNKYRYAEWYYGPEQRLMLAYTLSTKSFPIKLIDGGIGYKSSKITAAFQDITESRHSRRYNKNTRQDRTENVKVASINADFQIVKRKNEIRYGGEVIYNKVTSTGFDVDINTKIETPAISRYPSGGSNMIYSAVYATLNRELGKGWVLNSGLRYNLVSLSASFTDTSLTKLPFTEAKQTNTALNGNLGVVYNTPKGWRVSALVSTGFRAPNVDDLGKVFDSSPNDSIVIVPNPNLKPEYTYNAEISVGKLLGAKASIEATAWYTLNKQAISTQPFSYNGNSTIVYDGVNSKVFANQNTASAYLYGASVAAKWNFYKHLTFIGTANYTYGRLETASTPTPLDHIAPLFGRAAVNWKKDDIEAELFCLFNGAKKLKDYSLNGEDNYYGSTISGMPAWYTISLRTAYKLSDFNMIQIAVENILDQNYRVFASGISAPGRNVVVTLRAWL